MATFSLDTRTPLGRLGLIVQIVFLAVVGLGLASVSHYVMAAKLPAGHAQHDGEKAAQAVIAAEGPGATAKAEEAGKKAYEESLAHGRQTWLPFEVFLSIIWALMTAGYLSVAVQRRLNDAGQHGTLAILAGHLGAWALMVFCGFSFLLESSDRLGSGSGWWIIPIVGGVLLLPSLIGGSGHGEDEEAH